MDKLELKSQSGEVFAIISKKRAPWVYIQWMGKVGIEEVKEGIIKCTNLMSEQHCSYLLSDRRLAEGNWFAINNWIEHKWAPIAIKAGLQYIAHVTAPEVTSQLSSKDLESRVLGFEFKYFESIRAAEKWLKDHVSPEPN